jgi:hypothetical protein
MSTGGQFTEDDEGGGEMTSKELDLLIQQAVTGAQIATGHRVSGDLSAGLFSGVQVEERSAKAPTWNLVEEKFIVENYATISDAEIGKILNRSATAIHIHREREMNLPAPSKSPGVVTVNRAAKILGMSSCHALGYWFEVGLVPGYRLPGGNMCRLIRMDEFTRWVCTPANWVYIDIDKIRDERLYRMAHKRLEHWGDAWWTTAQVAEYHGVAGATIIAMHIKHGYLKGMQPEFSIGGRNLDRSWKYWRILRSEAIALKIHSRTGTRSQFTPRGEAWILKARDELHFSWVKIANSINPSRPRPGRRMATEGAVWQRYKKLKDGKP